MENVSFLSTKNTEGKVAPSCIVCENKTCLKTKKPCQAIEALLPKPYGGIDGKKIKFYAPDILEKISNEEIGRRYTTKGGKQKKSHLPQEN